MAGRDSQLPQAELVAALRDNVGNPWKPPGGGYEGALSHDIIHGLDLLLLVAGRTIPRDLFSGPGARRLGEADR